MKAQSMRVTYRQEMQYLCVCFCLWVVCVCDSDKKGLPLTSCQSHHRVYLICSFSFFYYSSLFSFIKKKFSSHLYNESLAINYLL